MVQTSSKDLSGQYLLGKKEECVHNKSDEMLNIAMSDEDGLYWEAEVIKTLPAKRKKIKVDGIRNGLSLYSQNSYQFHQNQMHYKSLAKTHRCDTTNKKYHHPGCTNGGFTGLNNHTINQAGLNFTTCPQQNKFKA